MRLAGTALSLLLAASPAFAQPAQPATAAKETPAQRAPAKKDAKAKDTNAKSSKPEKKAAIDAIAASYTAIPLNERISIQNDLIWTGDYNGIVSGDFGERAIAAVKAFQKRNGGKETGVLNQPERATLAAAAKPKQDQVGWRMTDDPATGARIGVPGKLVPQQSQIVGGTRWASARGEIFGRDIPHHAARDHVWRALRENEKGASGTQGGLRRLQAGLLRHFRPAEPEEILRAGAAAR